MLEARAIRKEYSAQSRSIVAIDELSFTASDGEMVCIVGPSGCGKTTLLRCLSGLLTPTQGTVLLRDRPILEPPPELAIVFQEYGRSLFPWLTVGRNVDLPLKQKGVPRRRRSAIVETSLHSVGLSGVTDAYPWQLSGGMQQRVAIARAIAFEPTILLMDEPFAAVDAQTRADLEDLVRKLWSDRKLTVVFVTHDIEEAIYLGDRVLVLSESPTRIVADISVDLPREREQVSTRSLTNFIELRRVIHALIRNPSSAHHHGHSRTLVEMSPNKPDGSDAGTETGAGTGG